MSESTEVIVILKGPVPDARFRVDMPTDIFVRDAKDEIIVTLGNFIGYALDPKRYDLRWEGSFAQPVVILAKLD